MLWQCPDKRGTRLGLWHLSLPGVWHMTFALTLVHELLCRPDVSPGFLYPFPRSLKTKSRKLWWAMIRLCKLLDNLLCPGTAWEWSRNRHGNERGYLCGGPSFGDKFQVGGKRVNSYLLSSADAHLHTGTGWKRTSDRLGNGGRYFCGAWGRRYGDEFKGGGEMVDSYPTLSDTYLNSEIVWKTPGGHSLDIKIFHGRRERDLKGVAVCSSFHSSSVDTRGSWCRN